MNLAVIAKKTTFVLALSALVWAGSGVLLGAEEKAKEAKAADAPAEPPQKVLYEYSPVKTRDPFIELGAGRTAVFSSGALAQKEAGAFSLEGLRLVGIVKTPIGRWATLRSERGASYTIKNGKIFTSKRKPVKGFVGIIKEKKVVLIGPDNQVAELNLRKKKDDENNP